MLRLSLLLSRRLLSSSVAPSLILSRRPSLPPPSHAARFTAIRCRANRAGNSAYSSLNSSGSSNFSERPPADMAPLFPRCDYEHWLIVMDKPGGEGATKQQMIDCYIQTLAKVVGSEEEAKKKIYNVSCERYFGFGCEIDEETSNKLEGLPGVLFALPDSSYVVPEYKDYGAKFFENGEIVQRWPERKGWEEQKPQISRKNRYRSKDRIRQHPVHFRIVTRLVGVKHKCGKSYNQLAEETGLTNVYVAQLLRRQAQLKPDTAPKLRAALPGLPEELVREMMRTPWRTYDPNLSEDPTVYRLNEAVMHFGESIKEIINEEFGDGIMSAIDFYCSVDKVKGVDGKDRVVVTFDWKYFPYSKQKSEHMVSRTSPLGNQ